MKNAIGHSPYAYIRKTMAFFFYDYQKREENYDSRKLDSQRNMDHKPSKREKEHRILARKAAEKGIVLLKNQGILPLSPSLP